MNNLNVYNQAGTVVSTRKPNAAVFDVKINPAVVQQAVVAQQANARPVLAHTKGRGDVSGGGKKPWRQKGTGRARHGSIRSPLWRGGGVTFGPTAERNFKLKINKKVRRKAILMSLSSKAADERIVLLDSLTLTAIKTKTLVSVLEALKLWPVKEKKTKAAPAAVEQKTNAAANATPPARLASSDLGSTPSRDEEAKRAKRRKPRVLIVMPASDQTIVKSARNIPGVSVVSADSLNVLAVLNHQYLLMPIQSLEKIEQTFLAT